MKRASVETVPDVRSEAGRSNKPTKIDHETNGATKQEPDVLVSPFRRNQIGKVMTDEEEQTEKKQNNKIGQPEPKITSNAT